VLNKFGPSGNGEAQVQYLDGDFRVKYWSVDLQEAYAIPTAVLQRHFPAALK
jgi:hypothetical protein